MAHCRKVVFSIFLNEGCNLGCKYCYINSNTKVLPKLKLIDFNFVKKAILDFFNNNKSRQIRFFSSGEPTMAFEYLRTVRDWIFNVSGGTATFEIQTNGYFSDQVAEWLSDNIDTIWISYDGPRDAQNYYRPTLDGKESASVVEKNIRFLSKNPKLILGIRSSVGTRNLYLQREMIDFFYSFGIKVIMLNHIFPSVSGDEGFKDDLNLMEFAKEFLKARKYALSKDIFYGNMLAVNFDEKTDISCRACVPYPHLTVDGYISCCDMACSGNDHKMKDLIYGRYNKEKDEIEYDQAAIEKIRSRKADNMPHCKDCEVLYNCAGACLGEALNETGSIFGVKPDVCKAIKFLAKNMPLNEGIYPYRQP